MKGTVSAAYSAAARSAQAAGRPEGRSLALARGAGPGDDERGDDQRERGDRHGERCVPQPVEQRRELVPLVEPGVAHLEDRDR